MAQDKGVLIDLTKCIGCGSCTVACKLWNKVEFNEKAPMVGSGAKLNDKNWTVVERREAVTRQGEPVYRYVKQQCMHCKDPACVSACFSRALQKDENGAVVYYPDLCVGCRYCMVACPFDVPKYEWEKALPLVAKCQMCATRLAKGASPACVDVCPTGAMTFGNSDELLQTAQSIVANDNKYIKHIYGAKEIGGTNWLYISDVNFVELGFKTDMEDVSPVTYTRGLLSAVPFLAVTWGVFLTAMALYSRRRRKLEGKKGDSDNEE